MIRSSAYSLLKRAISSFAESRARQERAHILWVDKKISNEKYIEIVGDFVAMEDELNALVGLLTSRTAISHAEFEKALSVAPNCLKFTYWSTQKQSIPVDASPKKEGAEK